MKALTLHQPWAHLVASGAKLVENRPWEPPAFLVGKRFAIHAGKKWDQEAADKIEEVLGLELTKDDVIFGAVLATARLVKVVTSVDDIADVDQHKFFFGPHGWILEDVVAIDPIPQRGYQKLWSFDESRIPRPDFRPDAILASPEKKALVDAIDAAKARATTPGFVPADRTCAGCGEAKPVVVEMDGGWRLCSLCYRS